MRNAHIFICMLCMYISHEVVLNTTPLLIHFFLFPIKKGFAIFSLLYEFLFYFCFFKESKRRKRKEKKEKLISTQRDNWVINTF